MSTPATTYRRTIVATCAVVLLFVMLRSCFQDRFATSRFNKAQWASGTNRIAMSRDIEQRVVAVGMRKVDVEAQLGKPDYTEDCKDVPGKCERMAVGMAEEVEYILGPSEYGIGDADTLVLGYDKDSVLVYCSIMLG